MNLKTVISSRVSELYVMIGSPITQVKSPELFNDYFRKNEMDAELVAVDVQPPEVEGFFDFVRSTPRIKGCIVTVPHKQSSARFLDELSSRAEALRAVNVIRSAHGILSGDMVDGLGFLQALRNHGFELSGKQVALIGAGAVGSAIALALCEAGISRLTVHEVDSERYSIIRSLVERCDSVPDLSFELQGLAGFDLVINASPVGMGSDEALPFPMDDLQPSALVFDVVTKPRRTAWLSCAMTKGCEVVYGEEMVQGQFELMARHMGLEV